MGDASVPGSGVPGEAREPEGSPAGNAVGDAVIDSSEDDFVHESVELPDWIPVVFGLILITIAAIAIWMAAGGLWVAAKRFGGRSSGPERCNPRYACSSVSFFDSAMILS